MLRDFFDSTKTQGEYNLLKRDAQNGELLSVFGVVQNARPWLCASLSPRVLYIAKSAVEAREVAVYASGIANVVEIAEKPEVLQEMKKFSSESYFARLSALSGLQKLESYFAIATAESLLQLFPHVENFSGFCGKLKVGEEFPQIANFLAGGGFVRRDRVESRGEFSLRGDILDLCLASGEAFRVDFFGDEVERIRNLSIETNRSYGGVSEVDIFPATDIFYGGKSKENMLANLKMALPIATSAGVEHKAVELYSKYSTVIEAGDNSRENSQILPLTKTSTIFDYLAPDTLVCFGDLRGIEQTCELLFKEHQTRYEMLAGEGEILQCAKNQMASFDSFIREVVGYRVVNMAVFAVQVKNQIFTKTANLQITQVPQYIFSEDNLAVDLANWGRGGYTVIICAKDAEGCKILKSRLEKKGFAPTIKENASAGEGGISILPIFYPNGFCLHKAKTVVIGTNDVFRREKEKVAKKKRKNAFTSFSVGDYVVHENHGIGRLEKIDKVANGGVIKDYAILKYNDATVYLPTDQMDLLSRYSGTDKLPVLSKIGGREFEKVKAKVLASLKAMAIDLRALYKKRERGDGFAFGEDTSLAKEFEDAFPFEETPDQLSAIEDVKSDMQSDKIMDRLICGDVGYGKTEVAFRAAFKAVENGKQVCFLAPTTILSQQHYTSALKRFENTGVRVSCINRFRTKQQQDLILKELASGRVDILFGTHRLLSKDVIFSDLGLLILDEEQRFGVEHKEKIKQMKSDVDVLAMSATPIPRTLNMSLSGIRKISTIETPPKKRLPIQTVVAEERDGLIKDAVLRELSRGGQVFILYNRVESIDSFAGKIQGMFEDAKVIVTHGKMKGSALERAIETFASGGGDILVSTTIIENGINIPNANTMIVIDADRLGLSQAYQLKGRVGRSDKLAYVYFTYKENKVLSENAYKRLSAITEFSEFGSGFKIAMRDLEIRGAGSLLGREQSGHMEKIGYETYAKLLSEVVGGADGVEKTEKINVEVETDISSYIDVSYIESAEERMEIYYELSQIASANELNLCLEKIVDAHGKMRKETENLAKIGYIRNLGGKIYAKKIIGRGGVLRIILSGVSLNKKEVSAFISKYHGVSKIEAGEEMVIVFSKIKGDFLDGVIRILE